MPAQAAAPSYFVEFRARTHFYGHVYVAYGTLNERGEPANFLIAGLYPDGGAAGFALGHIVPVPASVDGVDDDRNLPSQAVYRRNLSADDYARLLTGIQNLRNRPHLWHAVTYNCVIFAALIADSIGLKAPSVLILPVPFVELLRILNDP